MHRRTLTILCGILFLKALLMVWAMLHAGIGLGPDEAQYWTWSQLLDWGYYSKPPGIAWEIWAGTALFGNTELGVRFGALVIGFFIPLVIYLLAKNCGLKASGCFWAALAFALSPIGIAASFLAITDGGMVLFWTAACASLARAIQEGKSPNYAILGLLIFCGALFKWPIYFLWPLIFVGWIFIPRLISGRIIWGIVISLLALLPSLYWNWTHDWATFRHVQATLSGGHAQPKAGILSGNGWEFLGAQAVLVSPILFVLLLCGLWNLYRQRHLVGSAVKFCGGITFLVLLGATTAAIFMKMQGNWAIFAYPTAFVVLGWYTEAFSKKKWLVGGVVVSVLLTIMVFSVPAIQSANAFKSFPIPYRLNIFKHNVGWQKLDEVLKQVGYEPKKNFLLADKYQMASILSFYGPGQKRAYFLNLHGVRKNQFSYWPGIAEEQAKKGYFVAVENVPQLNKAVPNLIDSYQQHLKPYFHEVKFLGIFPLFSAYESMVKGALIFECSGYTGVQPPESGLY